VATAEEERAGALATFFTAGYIAISLPVLGLADAPTLRKERT